MRSSAPIGSTPGAPSTIKARQNEPEHFRRLLAYSRSYDLAQRWRVGRMLGTLVLAGVAPFIAYFAHDASDVLAAVAAGWLVIGRALMDRFERKHLAFAVSVQELYDTQLFGLSWNSSLCGAKPSEVEIAAAAKKKAGSENPYRDWYTIDLSQTTWPGDVVLCQRQSSSWSRGDQQAYADFIVVVAAGWFLVGLVLALVSRLEVSDYLIRLFLPCAPAFLDAVELSQEHRRSASRREALTRGIEAQWEEYCIDAASLTEELCRENQDASYLSRSRSSRVPQYFYRLRKASADAATREGTEPLLAAKNQTP